MKATGEVAVAAAAVVVVVVEFVVPIEYNKNSGVYTMKLSWVFFFSGSCIGFLPRIPNTA